MRILNLGCGTKVSLSPDVVNIDWSVYLRVKKNRLLRAMASVALRGERLNRFNALSDNIVVHDLADGIPFDSDSVDVVYHSHVLEHLDRNAAKGFLLETIRVLKPDGIQRIVVPDLEKICRAYILHLSMCEGAPDEARHHDSYIAALIEQSVRREAYGTSQQPLGRRLLENVVLGDARRRGETHQWMYDRINLGSLLMSLGFRRLQLQDYSSSLIPEWSRYGLDLNELGNEYKPGSLYLEAQK
jgi:SAM-dependent methyltransferase